MKKKVFAVILAAAMTLSLAACGGADTSAASSSTTTDTTATTETTEATDTSADTAETTEVAEATEPEGMQDGKFTETRKISVEVYDREGATPANDNVWTDWIKAQMLDRYNIEVEFVAVPRWTEVDQINNLLAAGDAPDICYTYDYSTIQTYANMGGVVDLNEYLAEYKPMLTNLWDLLGDANIYYDQDPALGTVWCVEGLRNNTYRINTFVRQDWLDALGLAAPTTTAEFHDMLVAFKDNAETLLGADADKMVPFEVTSDVGWTAAPLIESFMDPAITDKEFYVNGYDDRKFTENGTKEAIRTLNGWYNEGLMWNDFAISETSVGEDLIKAGFVGAFCQNYDMPFRNGVDSYNAILKATYGDGAKFVSVNCFNDKNGKYSHYSYSSAGDRKSFFPATNDEILASLLYLDFISSQEAIQYLQTGEEGINHVVLDNGAIAIQAVSEENVAYTQNSGNNIDLTMTCNGLRLATPELTNQSLAYAYAEVDPADVITAMQLADQDAIMPKAVNVGTIEAEAEATDLAGKRDETYCKSVVCAPADFDATWDAGMADYLAAGGQAIIDERTEKFEATYSSDMID